MTAPWVTTSERAVRARHVVTVSVDHPDHVDPLPVDVEQVDVQFDEAWSPHVQAEFECKVPAPDVVDLLDPRRPVRVVIAAGYDVPSAPLDVHPVADLALLSRDVERRAGRARLTMTAGSDETYVHEWEPLGETRNYPATALVSEVLPDLLAWSLDSPSIVNTLGSPETLGAPLELGAGANVWETLTDLADRTEGWVYDAGLRTWRIRPRPVIAGQSVAILRTGPAGTITESRAVLARAPWANAVRVTLADDVTGWAATPAGDEPRRVHTVTRASTPGSTTTAQRSAAAILRRMLSRGRSARVTAPALYWVRPGHTVTIELPTGGQRRYIVSRARFTHPGDRMTLDVRTPADAPITTGE